MTDELVRRVQDLVCEHYVFADRADDIADYGRHYYSAISYTTA